MTEINGKILRQSLCAGLLLLLGFSGAFAQSTPVKRIFLAEITDKLKPRREYVEDVFRKKLTAAGFKFVKDAKRADAVLTIAVERRTTLMMDDNQTWEIYKFKLNNPRGKRIWQSETIIKDYQTVETVAAELLKALKNSAQKRAVKITARRTL